MKFLEWLDSEIEALDKLDAMEAGMIPVGPVTFTKRDGTPFQEFVQLAKAEPDGTRETLICNEGGFNLYQRHLKAMLDNTPPDATPGSVRRAAEEALAAAEVVSEQVSDLSKRVDALAAEREDLIEVTPEQLAGLFTEAVEEAGADS